MRNRTQSRSGHKMFWRLASGLGVALTVRAALREWRRLRLRDKVVLITGGSRGLGFLLAREFAHQGSRIAICARDPGELRRAVADLAQTEVEVLAVPCDISCQDQVERMVERVRQRFGRIDVLVNNAGVIQVGPMESMTPADYEECLRVMLWGMIYPTMAVLPLMRGQGAGRIVNITSIGGKVSVPHLLPYGCAKFAAVGFSEGLHAELARQGIRVVTVVPGLMRTGSFLNASFKGQEENEYVWFSLGATLPGISMDAERPARQIVRAAEFGDAEVTLSLPARVLARFQGLFPGLTADLLGLVNRLLPGAESADTGSTRGAQIHARLDSTAFRMATQMGQSAAERFHELPGLAPRLEPRLAETPGRRPEEKEKEPAA